MSEQHDIVIIGAGIIGLCIADHISQLSSRQVTLMDAMGVGGGSSTAGAGFVQQWSAGLLSEFGAEGFALQEYGIQYYRQLHLTGSGIGLRENGILTLARSKRFDADFLQPWLEPPLIPAGMRRLALSELEHLSSGGIKHSEFCGALLNPSAIQIETDLAMIALEKRLVELGCRILAGTRLEEWSESSSGVELMTSSGRISCKTMVFAAGAWTNELVRSHGWEIPMCRVVATRIKTKPCSVNPAMPAIICPELGLWLRASGEGLTWGSVYGYAPLGKLTEEVPALAPGRPQVSVLARRLSEHHDGLLSNAFPVLEGAETADIIQGLICYTLDRNLVAGRVPRTNNIFIGAGDNETGVTHGPGLGRLLAEMILDRPCSVSPDHFIPDRFPMGETYTEEELQSTVSRLLSLAPPL